MSDSLDSWKKFAEAGFVEDADGKLRLGIGRCFCTVARVGGELAVHFEPGVSDFQAVNFKVPGQMEDFWQWVAFVTSRIVGSPERWRSLRKAVGDEMPEDLVDLLNIAVDHVDEAPGTESEEMRPKMTAADLPELLQVRKRLERARDTAWEQLRQAMQNQDLVRVKDCTARAEYVDDLLTKFGEVEVFLRAELGEAVGVDAVDVNVTPASDKEDDIRSDAIGIIASTSNANAHAGDDGVGEADEDVFDEEDDGRRARAECGCLV